MRYWQPKNQPIAGDDDDDDFRQVYIQYQVDVNREVGGPRSQPIVTYAGRVAGQLWFASGTVEAAKFHHCSSF